MIAIIDYKMGNLRSVQKAFEFLGAKALITNDLEIISASEKIILPGVGAFPDGMKNLRELGLVELLNDNVLKQGKAFLGICLGMQLLGETGFENGETSGLGWLPGEIKRFDFSQDKKLKIPHVGWNSVSYTNETQLFRGIEEGSDFYFVHSYHFSTEEQNVTGTCTHGVKFTASVEKGHIFGTQFHPEKSQKAGLKLLQNFLDL